MQSLSKKNTTLLLFLMVIIKALYIYLNVLMLPDRWQVFDFDRNIALSNLLIEAVFYFPVLAIYLKFYQKGNPISFLATILFCVYFIPNNSCMSLSSYSMGYFTAVNVYCLFLFIFIGKLTLKVEKEEQSERDYLNSNKTFQTTFRIVTIVTCVLTIGYVFLIDGGLNFSKVFEEDMYDVRAQLAEFYMQNTDGLLAYIMLIWTAFYSLVLIMGLYLALVNKHYIDALFILFTYCALFTLSMEKGLLMRPVIAIFLSILTRKGKLNSASELFAFGFALFMLVSGVEYFSNKESVIYSVVIRRISYMPAYLTHTYYEFFDVHDKVWFTRDLFQLEKFVRLIYPGSYSTGIVQTISEEVFDNGIPSPNTGLFAEAFSQTGYWGILIFPPIVVLAFKYLNKCSSNFGVGASMVILTQFALSMTNMQLLSSRTVIQILLFLLLTLLIKKSAPKQRKRYHVNQIRVDQKV